MSASRGPVDQALDLFVFAPLGLAVLVAEQLPELAGRGRQRFESRTAMARVVGQFAVDKGRAEATTALRRVVGSPSRPAPPSPPPPPAPAAPAAPPAPPPGAGTTAGGGESPADLAIPGYDSLSAPQVVARLDGLSGEELTAVRVYETATRGRRTVLGRIAQLQALLD